MVLHFIFSILLLIKKKKILLPRNHVQMTKVKSHLILILRISTFIFVPLQFYYKLNKTGLKCK